MNRTIRRVLILLAVLPGFSVTSNCQQAELSSEQKADQAYLEGQIMAPCCWAPLSDHDSPVAKALKAEVVRRVRGGQDRDAILTAFVEQQGGIKEMVASYDVQGAQILARPPASGFGSMAYIMPVVAVLFGLGLVGFVFKRLMGEESGAVIEAPSDPSDQTATESSQRRRIEKELADYDF